MKRKVVVISSYTKSLIIFRKDLLVALKNADFEVFALGPDNDKEVFDELEGLGISPLCFSLAKDGLNPMADIKTIFELRKIFKKLRPDFILPYTVKPVIYSNLAKKGLRILSINWITGLGFYGMPAQNFKELLAKNIMSVLYRAALKSEDAIIFQNKEDKEFFRSKKILKKNKSAITPGSGINLESFTFSPPPENKLNFLFVGRLIKSKGISLFLESAEVVKKLFPFATFTVVGWIDENSPDKISQEALDFYIDNNIIEFAGKVDNVIDYIRESSVMVLPSIYREGVPRSILEALAVGRAIITTNNVGCKETVKAAFNGILIEKNDKSDLINAMKNFCNDCQKITVYGANSRQLAEERFDVRKVNKIIIDVIKEFA